MNEDLADALGIASNRGAFIQSVQPGEPAERPASQAGDVVLRVDGKEVTPTRRCRSSSPTSSPASASTSTCCATASAARSPVTVGRRPSEEELAAQQTFDPDAENPTDVVPRSAAG